MDEIFGLSMNTLMAYILGLLAVIGLALALLAYRNPLLFKLGLRNVPRRKAQTALIVFGLMLSTLIISSAFTTGDTLASSLRGTAFQIAGRIDHLIQYDTDPGRSVSQRQAVVPQRVVDDLKAEFQADPDIEGFTRALFDTVAMFNSGTQQLLPLSFLLGLDPDEVEAIGGIPSIGDSPLSLDLLGQRGIILNQTAARELAADVGHKIEVTVLGARQTFKVVAIAADTLLSGEVNPRDAQGAVVRLLDAQTIFQQQGVMSAVGVTVRGGVTGALARSEVVETRLNLWLEAKAAAEVAAGIPPDARIYADAQDRAVFTADPFKANAVHNAETFGSIFTTLFLVMGLFSIGAGVMLIFLIFVMLAEERKTEMGIARAVGMRRTHLVEAYLAEGVAYSLGAAVVGAALGVLVAFAMIDVLDRVVEDFGFSFQRHVEPRSLVIAAGLGIILTFITVTVSAFRVSQLNIVAAIRDIPENKIEPRRPVSLAGLITTTAGLALLPLTPVLALPGIVLLALPGIGSRALRREWGSRIVLPVWSLMRWRPEWWFAMLFYGAVFAFLGGRSGSAFLYLLGLSLVPIGLLLLARRRRRAGRFAHSLMGAAILLLWLSPFSWHEALGIDVDGGPEMFFLSGSMMVTGGTVFLVFNLSFLVRGLGLFSAVFGRLRPVVQTAAAYPAMARFRTGMTVAMIAIIMFALVMFTTINSNFQRLFTSDVAGGGYQIQSLATRNAPFTDLEAALVAAGAAETAGDLVDTGRLTIGSMFGSDIVTRETQRWDKRSEQPVLDADGEPITVTIAPELAESAFDASGALRPGAASDPANLVYRTAFLAGADDAFLDHNGVLLQTRAVGYESDAAVWAALRTSRPDGTRYAVVTAVAVPGAGGPFGFGPHDAYEVPDLIEEESRRMPVITALVRNPATGGQQLIRIIGVIDQVVRVTEPAPGVLMPTVFVAEDVVLDLYPDPDLRRHLAKLRDGVDAFATAQTIEATLRVETVSIADELRDQQDTANAILGLFQGFTGLGLLAGMAALGVIAVRAVVERRQQIGMLRAIGFSRGFVWLGMMLEMSFIALLGIVLGTGLAVALAWRLFDEGAFGSTAGAGFTVPVARIALFMGVALLAALVLTYLPARQAARTTIAEALRYE